jgi:hypothetical protein
MYSSHKTPPPYDLKDQYIPFNEVNLRDSECRHSEIGGGSTIVHEQSKGDKFSDAHQHLRLVER